MKLFGTNEDVPDPTPAQGIALVTKSGRSIPNERVKEHATERLRSAKRTMLEGNLTRACNNLSATYNCVGMVFANRRTHVDPKWVRTFLMDDGFAKLSGVDQTMVGDVVVYLDSDRQPMHVGIVSHRPVLTGVNDCPARVLSQWGSDGEYLHNYDDLPQGMGRIGDIEYWTHRNELARSA